MSGHTFAADDLLTADDINLYLARIYEYAYNGTPTAVPTPLNAWNNFPGQLAVDIEVNATGVLWVEWGFEGWADHSSAASVWVTPYLTGANEVAPSVETGARVSTKGTQGPRSTSRMLIFTGLTPGVTTVTLLGRIDDTGATVANNFVDNQWLYVRNFQ